MVLFYVVLHLLIKLVVVMKNSKEILDLLKRELVFALGCTEPIAVALASAYARRAINVEPETIEVHLSGNVLKNGMGVGIPGSSLIGLHIASALGAIGGVPDDQLEVAEGHQHGRGDPEDEDLQPDRPLHQDGVQQILRKNHGTDCGEGR